MSAVTLRRATPDDASFLLRIRSEPSAALHQPLRPLSLDQLSRQLASRAGQPLDRAFDGKAQWVALVAAEPAGWVTLTVTSREHGVAAVGYTIAESHRRRGVATAALRNLIEMAFDPYSLALDRLEAVAAVENIASRRVLVNAGFYEEGVARQLLIINGVRVDHVRFSLLRSDHESWSKMH